MLSIPPAFVLSQDQTLYKKVCKAFRLKLIVNVISRVDIFERVSLLFDVDICQLIYRFYGTILFSMTLAKD